MTSNENTVKDSFALAKEVVEQDSKFFLGSLGVDSFFTNISLEKTIEICAKTFFENKERDDGLSKIEFKELYLLRQNNLILLLTESSSSKLIKLLWV